MFYNDSKEFLNEILKFNFKKKQNKVSLVIVTHFLKEKIDFIDSLNNYFNIAFVIPKPKSIDKNVYEQLKKNYKILNYDRFEIIKQKEKLLKILEKTKWSVIILDIWWYFSWVLSYFLKNGLEKKIIWIIEDTENWHQKYEKVIKNINIPIYSVARSILKDSEDFLVWKSIIFSTDFVLRLNNVLFENKKIWIIWFWKIWKSIALNLKWRVYDIKIYDINPFKWIEILSNWFIFTDKNFLFKEADVIFLATGNLSIKQKDFLKLKDWVIIASVTFSDDELDMEFLMNNAKRIILNKYTILYILNWKKIYMLNDGNAINFINNTVILEFIYLVEAEMIHSIKNIIWKKWIIWKINTIDNNKKIYIAELFLKYFNN